MKTVELKLIDKSQKTYTDVTKVNVHILGSYFGTIEGQDYKITFPLKDVEYIYETEVSDKEYEHLITFEGGYTHDLRIEAEGSPLTWGSSLVSANGIIACFFGLLWSGKDVKLYNGNELWFDNTSKVLPSTGRIENSYKLYFNGTHDEAEKVRSVLSNLLYHSGGKVTLETQ